jgi:hypothetical protein
MTDPRIEDHLVGLELQLVELVENKQRAEIQGRVDDAKALETDIQAIQTEMATTAEKISAEDEEAAAPRAHLAAPTAGGLRAA